MVHHSDSRIAIYVGAVRRDAAAGRDDSLDRDRRGRLRQCPGRNDDGLYKTECIRGDSPFRTGPITTLADLEDVTSAWVHWYNTSRLMHRLGRRPPAEADYYAHNRDGQPPVHT
jgi:putative transposase